MKKIASPQDLQAELQSVMAFVHGYGPQGRVDREAVADKLNDLADRIATFKWDPNDISLIEQMTDRNNHTEALIVAADMLGLKNLKKKLTLVAQLQDMEGSMPMALREYRDSLYDALMAQAKRQLDPEQFKKFYGAF